MSAKIDKSNTQDICHLNVVQKGMLFHHLKEEDSNTFNVQLSFELKGSVDVDQLKSAFYHVQQKHDALRSIFRWEGIKEPVQIVLKEVPISWEEKDLSGCSASQLDVFLEQSWSVKFSLLDVPCRISLVTLGEDRRLLTITHHHILYDGWSTAILMKDWLNEYQSKNSAAPVSYKKVQDKAILAGEQLVNREYWKELFNGYDIQLLKDPEFKQSGSDSLLHEIITKENDTLTRFASQLRVTPAAFMYATVGVALQRLQGSNDLVFGTTVSGRNIDVAGIENTIGNFIQTLPLRLQLNDRISFSELVKSVNEQLVQREEVGYIGVSELKEICGLGNAENPFNVNVVIENYPIDESLLNANQNLSIDVFDVKEKTDSDLLITVFTEPVLRIEISASSNAFTESFTKKISAYLEDTLERCLQTEDVQLSSLYTATDKDRLQIETFNSTSKESYFKEETLLDLMELQRDNTPDAIAIEIEGKTLTYGELHERSNQLAHYLIEEGYTNKGMVPICLDRSLEMIVGILGIMKSGCGYVPVDPEYPQERIDFILEDVGSSVICSSSETGVSIPSGVHKLNIDTEDFSDYTSTRPAITINRTDIAYVIYTSGTTGRPKGVINEHGGIYNRLLWMRDYLGLEQSDVILQKTTFCFDVSVWELLMPLFTGTRMVLARPGGHKDSQYLQDVIERSGVTVMHFVPSMLHAFLHDLSEGRCSELKHVVCSGEELKGVMVDLFKEKFKTTHLHNLYGPTEAAIDVTAIDLSTVKKGAKRITIGSPVANTHLYIVDDLLQIQPLGVAGELLIGGVQVARGYLNREELTAEKFISSPFKDGERLYRTGDLARWLSDGTIEYLGRIDHQVKLRGYRIELGEIESRLSEFGSITESAVLLQRDGDHSFLVGYYVSEESISDAELRTHLLSRLPEYMVPSHFMHLTELPLTTNGKLNRKALPKFSFEVVAEKYIAPETETEIQLANLWAEILSLELDKISKTVSFFELGGQSLKAITLTGIIWKRFDIKLSLNDVFNTPVLSEMARLLESAEQQKFSQIPTADIKEFYQLSSAQTRMHFLYDFDPKSTTYNMPFAAQLNGKIDSIKLEEAFQKLIARHSGLRTNFGSEDGKPVQVISSEVSFSIERLVWGSLQEQEVINRFIRPFDLENDTLIRVGVASRSEMEHLLLVDMHHIIADGVTHGILIDEFVQLYQGETLSDVTHQYVDFAEWESDNQDRWNESKSFWNAKFKEELTPLQLPTSFTRPQQKSYKGNSLSFSLDRVELEQLEALGREANTTLFSVLYSCYLVFLNKFTQQSDFVVGTPVAGRLHENLERVVGMFVNTLPLRSQVNTGSSFHELLLDVREEIEDALMNQEYPYEMLIDDLKLVRDTSRNALFDTVFVLQNFDQKSLYIDGVELEQLKNINTSSKFDLTLTAVPGEQGIDFMFEYDSDLFEEVRILEFIDGFKQLVTGILVDATTEISALKVLSNSAKQEIKALLNHESVEYPTDATLLDLFSEQVAKTPDHIALQYNDEQLSYADLDRRSSAIGAYLQDRGVEADTIVGLLTDRTLDTVVCMLGILKAGGAYLPIDVDYPEDRKRYIITDSETKFVLTGKEVDTSVVPEGVQCLYIEDISEELSANYTTPEVGPSNLCYIIYTSGTTGKPKGVMIEHGNVVRLFVNESFQFEFGSDDVWTMFHSHCFDFSVWEMYGALLFGGKLIIVPKWQSRDTSSYVSLLKDEGVTVLNQTPSAFYNLIQQEESLSGDLSLRYVIFGGEALSPGKLSEFHAVYPSVDLINMFGITETTVHVTYKKITSEDIERNVSNIGLPIPTLSMYVLDGELNEVPRGVVGEMYIGGRGVARGYLNRPELSAERFIESPFVKGERLYKSGDLGRLNSAGELEYIGRIDHQVQLRGFRIELGEIENQLSAHDMVDQSAVTIQGSEEDKNLVAYYVSDTPIESMTLRSHLLGLLPDYMVPSIYVHLDTLPLTPNGKTDKKALPEVAFGVAEIESKPQNQIQKELIFIWAQLLDMEMDKIGINTNFFELGGNSLMVVNMVKAINEKLNAEISVANVFANPVISSLAAFLSESEEEEETEEETFDLMGETLGVLNNLDD